MRLLPASASGRVLVAVALLISVAVGTRGITREESFFFQGDPPRYLLNGAFIYDLLRAGVWHPDELIPFAERYFARYPALSLGHHPPGLPASLVPFYALFGISVFAGRIATLVFFGIAVALLYYLTKTLYGDEEVAGWASLLFASSPNIAFYGQHLLAEMPAIASVLAALIFLDRLRRSGGLTNLLLFVAMATGSLLYRPTALYMVPAYLVFVLRDGGYRRLAERRVAIAMSIGVVGLGIASVGFVALSPFNAGVVFDVVKRGIDWATMEAMYWAWMRQRPLMAAAVGGALIGALAWDRRAWIPLIWIGSVLTCAVYLTGSIEPDRYSVLAVPAFCILGAGPMAHLRPWTHRAAWAFLLTVVIFLHVRTTFGRPTLDTPGYEAAAQYIMSQPESATVLYSASVDPGYFIFFVRKHDPGQRMVILRSDKVLTTSHMAQLSVEDRIDEPAEIFEVLQTYGTRFIVIEDRASGSEVLDWLRDLVKNERFAERGRFPIGRGNRQLEGVSLVVYEYLDATAPAPDAELDLNIALIGRRIRVPLADLSPSLKAR